MLTAIILHDDKITFPTQRGFSTGHTLSTTSVESMYTKKGLFVSPVRNGNEFIDLDEGLPIEGKSVSPSFAGILVTHRGSVYRYARLDQNIAKNRIQMGPGSYTVFSIVDELEQAIMMAMHLTKRDVKKALALVAKDLIIRPDSYVTMAIKDVASELIKRGFTEDPVLMEPIGVKPLEQNK